MHYIREVSGRASVSAARDDRLSEVLTRAEKHAAIDTLPRRTRFRTLKRLVLRIARVFTHRQVAFNRAAFDALEDLSGRLGAARSEIDLLHDRGVALQGRINELESELRPRVDALAQELPSGLTRMQAGLVTAELSAQTANDAAARAKESAVELRNELVELRQRRAADYTELRTLAGLVQMLLSEARSRLPEKPDEDLASRLNKQLEQQYDTLYSQLEEAFRGSRAEIVERQRLYLDYVWHLREQSTPILDVGCGRGEWLELLKDSGIPSYGVDINGEFVRVNKERGIDARAGDVFDHLRELPDASIAAVTAFQFVEHVGLPLLIELIDGALRKLRPGGKLILETPNPTNLRVGAASFYLDPTHVKPVHPQFLSFLVTSRGFIDVETRYSNPSPEPPLVAPRLAESAQNQALERIVEELNWSLLGPMDYAVIGTKAPS